MEQCQLPECCVCKVEVVKASARRMPAVQVLLSVSMYNIACCATASSPSTSGSTPRAIAPSASTPASNLAPPLSPASGPSAPDCKLNTLTLLGWEQAYSPQGYTINTQLPSNCSSATWQGLRNLTKLTMTGHLPNLTNAWGTNDSFPALQAMKFSSATLAGTLPSSWAQDMAFPQLQTVYFSKTQLSGPLPATWGQTGAFQQLKVLHLINVNIAGDTVHECLACICCTLVSMLGNQYSQICEPGNWDMSMPCTYDQHILESDSRPDPKAAANTIADGICVGTIPFAWEEAGSFPALSSLKLGGFFLGGTLQASWGSMSHSRIWRTWN